MTIPARWLSLFSLICAVLVFGQPGFSQSLSEGTDDTSACASLTEQVRLCLVSKEILARPDQTSTLLFKLINESDDEVSISRRYGIFDLRATDEMGNPFLQKREALLEKSKYQALSEEKLGQLFVWDSGPSSICLEPHEQTGWSWNLNNTYTFTPGRFHFQIWKKKGSENDKPLLEFEVEIK
jgi:hypothetical protein